MHTFRVGSECMYIFRGYSECTYIQSVCIQSISECTYSECIQSACTYSECLQSVRTYSECIQSVCTYSECIYSECTRMYIFRLYSERLYVYEERVSVCIQTQAHRSTGVSVCIQSVFRVLKSAHSASPFRVKCVFVYIYYFLLSKSIILSHFFSNPPTPLPRTCPRR